MLLFLFSAIFANFWRKNGVFLKSQCVVQKRQFFRQMFLRIFFLNHNIGPWSNFIDMAQSVTNNLRCQWGM
jgi:hypothetical protein